MWYKGNIVRRWELTTIISALCVLPLAGRMHVVLARAAQVTSGPFAEVEPACSPDGKWLVFEYYHPDRPNKPQLWIMPTQGDFSQAHALVDDENYNAEVGWSPDSRWISYERIAAADHGDRIQLFKINVYTHEVVQLTRFPSDSHGPAPGDSTSWSLNGMIAFEMNGDIYEVDEKGGGAAKLLDVRSRFPSIEPSFIRWSPDGTRLCFVAKDQFASDWRTKIWIADVKSHEMSSLTDGDFPSWADNGHILFSRMLSEHESRLLILPVKGGQPQVVTKGHLDVMPSTDSTGSYIFFARGLPSRPQTNNLNIFEGFHIWRLKLQKR